MLRRFGSSHGLTLAQGELVTNNFLTMFDIPVLILTSTGLTVMANIYIKPGALALRRAKLNEAALSIWVGASGGANRDVMPPLDNGGWNRGPVMLCDSGGIATLSNIPIAGSQWIRLLAEHVQSGAQVAKGVWVSANFADLATLTATKLVRAGTALPSTFS